MWSIWNAPSDRDYYEQFNPPEPEPEEDPFEAYTTEDMSLFMTDPEEAAYILAVAQSFNCIAKGGR